VQLPHRLILPVGVLPQPLADTELGEKLETPLSGPVVVAVSAVGVVEVEDRREGFAFVFGVSSEVGDIDSLVGESGDELDAALTKGSITWVSYSSFATSARGMARSEKSSRKIRRMFASVSGSGLPSSPTSVHALMP
jgi:hypothetical protein